jgi:hypothetical protein
MATVSKFPRHLTLSPSLYGKLSHARNSRTWLPLSSILQIDRFRGSWHGQSGHFVKGTGPYCGHEERDVEEKLDITRLPEKGCHWRRRRTMGHEERKGKQWHKHGRGAGSDSHFATVTWVSCGSGALTWTSCGSHDDLDKWRRVHCGAPIAPHLPAPTNGQLNGIPPVRAPCEGLRQALGQN